MREEMREEYTVFYCFLQIIDRVEAKWVHSSSKTYNSFCGDKILLYSKIPSRIFHFYYHFY